MHVGPLKDELPEHAIRGPNAKTERTDEKAFTLESVPDRTGGVKGLRAMGGLLQDGTLFCKSVQHPPRIALTHELRALGRPDESLVDGVVEKAYELVEVPLHVEEAARLGVQAEVRLG